MEGLRNQLSKKFGVLEERRRGKFGWVYEARVSGHSVAIKIQPETDQSERERLIHDSLATMDSANIVQDLGTFSYSGYAALVMEYVPLSLADVKQIHSSEARELLFQLIFVLLMASSEKKFNHLDLHGSNILLSVSKDRHIIYQLIYPNGTAHTFSMTPQWIAQLCDFGGSTCLSGKELIANEQNKGNYCLVGDVAQADLAALMLTFRKKKKLGFTEEENREFLHLLRAMDYGCADPWELLYHPFFKPLGRGDMIKPAQTPQVIGYPGHSLNTVLRVHAKRE